MRAAGAIRSVSAACLWLLAMVPAGAAQSVTSAAALATLERAGSYFRDHLGVEGTFAWRYSVDGRQRRGEGGEIPHSFGWVQPPGTPAVGAAFMRIYDVTADRQWLDAAHAVATALVDGQLLSGGWSYGIETDPEKAGNWCYRASGIGEGGCRSIKGNPDRNKTMLDDNRTQSVLNFLMEFDLASRGADPQIRSSIDFALERLMTVQYENGAFAAVFKDRAAGAGERSAARASLPATWSRTWQKPDNPPYFIVNDNVPRDTGRMFLNAYRAYGDPAYLRAATRIGDFLLAAQLPSPQQGWAQLYDRSLQPIWGRKFEPPSVVSRETAGNVDYLVELHERTAKADYLAVAQAAADWLKAARLPDGSWARFYELGTNRPLYVDNDDHLTFEARDLLDHYGLKGGFEIEPVLERLERARRGESVAHARFWINAADGASDAELETAVRGLVKEQDSAGRWVDGEWIDGGRFVDGVFALARFIERAEAAEPSPR